MTLKQIQVFSKELDRLEKKINRWGKVLLISVGDPIKGKMFLNGERYLTGADYDEGFLNQPIGEAMANYDEELLNDHIRGEVEADKRAEVQEDQQHRWGEERKEENEND